MLLGHVSRICFWHAFLRTIAHPSLSLRPAQARPVLGVRFFSTPSMIVCRTDRTISSTYMLLLVGWLTMGASTTILSGDREPTGGAPCTHDVECGGAAQGNCVIPNPDLDLFVSREEAYVEAFFARFAPRRLAKDRAAILQRYELPTSAEHRLMIKEDSSHVVFCQPMANDCEIAPLPQFALATNASEPTTNPPGVCVCTSKFARPDCSYPRYSQKWWLLEFLLGLFAATGVRGVGWLVVEQTMLGSMLLVSPFLGLVAGCLVACCFLPCLKEGAGFAAGGVAICAWIGTFVWWAIYVDKFRRCLMTDGHGFHFYGC